MKRLIFYSCCCILFAYSCSKKKDPEPMPPATLYADPNVINLNATAGAIDSFIVKSTMNWTLAIAPGTSWLQADISNGGNGARVKITAIESNFGSASRSAAVTLSPASGNNVQPFTVTVAQLSKTPLFQVNINLLTVTGIQNDKDSFLVSGNVDWNVSSSVPWLSLSSTSGSNEKKVYVTNSEDNLTDVSRTAIITVTPVGTSLVAARTIAVTQKPWYRPLGGIGYDGIITMAKTPDGNLIFGGNTWGSDPELGGSYSQSDFWLIKTDLTGKKLWQKAFGGGPADFARSIAIAADGGYVMAGYTESNDGDVTNNHGHEDIWVIKTDAAGTLLWQKTFGGSGFEQANNILATSDGGFLLTGNGSSTDGDFTGSNYKDIFLLKIDGAGNKQWIKFYGGEQSEAAFGITPSGDGGYVLAGYTISISGDVTGNTGGMCAWVIKTDGNGNLVWQRTIPGLLATNAKAITSSGDGGFVIAGSVVRTQLDLNGNNDYNGWLAKVNGDGSVAWQKNYGGGNYDGARAITVTTSGSIIFTGVTWSNDGDASGFYGGGGDIWIMKTDANGNKQWHKTIGGAGYDEATCIVGMTNNTYLIGAETSSGSYNVSGADVLVDGVVLKIKE